MVYFDAARSMHLFPIHGHDIFPQRHRLTFRETIKPFLFTTVVGQAGRFWIVWGVIPWTLWFGTEDANDPPTKLVDCRRIGNAAIFACPSDFCTGCTVHTLPYWWQNLTTYWDTQSCFNQIHMCLVVVFTRLIESRKSVKAICSFVTQNFGITPVLPKMPIKLSIGFAKCRVLRVGFSLWDNCTSAYPVDYSIVSLNKTNYA